MYVLCLCVVLCCVVDCLCVNVLWGLFCLVGVGLLRGCDVCDVLCSVLFWSGMLGLVLLVLVCVCVLVCVVLLCWCVSFMMC